ncbi:hypothetical protein D3C76_1079710 [compost metagenome]
MPQKRVHAAGILAGLIGAGLLALFAETITHALSGFGQEVLNGVILIITVIMLGWHNLWMVVHGRELAVRVRVIGDAVSDGGILSHGDGCRGSFGGVARGLGGCTVSVWHRGLHPNQLIYVSDTLVDIFSWCSAFTVLMKACMADDIIR